MHALHCCLVEERVFDEIVWARLPPDHSHDAIDQLFSVLEAWLGLSTCPDLDTLWEQLAYLRRKLAGSEYACNKIELMTQMVNYAFD
eukprot:6193003-Pleurochrysis_carterae.AAC.1